LVKPGLDKRGENSNGTHTLTRCGLLVERLTKGTGDRVAMVAQKRAYAYAPGSHKGASTANCNPTRPLAHGTASIRLQNRAINA